MTAPLLARALFSLIPPIFRRSTRRICGILSLVLCASAPARGELAVTNYSDASPLKIMALGDSITDDCVMSGAWRLYLQPLLEANGYPFTFVGRIASPAAPGFTQRQHEGYCGAVIAAPGVLTTSVHGYPGVDVCLEKIAPDALTNVIPDLVLVFMGANDIGRGRDPLLVATNHVPKLLEIIFTNAPGANVILTKTTLLQGANAGGINYGAYATNVATYNAALQAVVNARRAGGQNVFLADMFSAVDYYTMFNGDHLHPNAAGLNAVAQEFLTRIQAITIGSDAVTSVLVAGGSDWKYSDLGQDLGTNWAQADYDDRDWRHGPARLGYGTPSVATAVSFGSNSLNRYTTTYFRRPLVVPPGVCFTNLNFRLARADGAAVWLNGRELFRTNLPGGPLNYQTFALSSVFGDASHIFYPTNLAIPCLPSGTNWLAVEIHKFAPTKTLLGFDLELIGKGYPIPPPPRLSIALANGGVLLTWPGTNSAGYILETSTNLARAQGWLPVGGPYILNGANDYEYREPIEVARPTTFYQLRFVGLPVGAPELSLTIETNAAALSWPVAFAGFNLESAADLPPAGSWRTVSGPYSLAGVTFQHRTPTAGARSFFRLRKP